jgi:hypothetical protein
MTWERFAGGTNDMGAFCWRYFSLLRISITLHHTQHTLQQTFKEGEEEIFNWRLTPWKISHF